MTSVVVRHAAGLDLSEESRWIELLHPEFLLGLAVDDGRTSFVARDLICPGERRFEASGLDLSEESRWIELLHPEFLLGLAVDDGRTSFVARDLICPGERRFEAAG